jgi:hypothetical protein
MADQKYFKFQGKIVFVGFGSVAQGVLPLLLRHIEIPKDVELLVEIERIVHIFRELRSGSTIDGRMKIKSPSATMSPAEAISVMNNGIALSTHFGNGQLNAHDLAAGLLGAVVKDPIQDHLVWNEYLETVVKTRENWRDIYRACKELE